MIPHRDTKYIVYRKQLLELVEKCPSCGLTLDVTEINKGSMVTFKRECSRCQEKTVWSSQPIVKDAMPAGNLEISAGICGQTVVELCAIRDGVADCDTLSYNNVCNLIDLISLD